MEKEDYTRKITLLLKHFLKIKIIEKEDNLDNSGNKVFNGILYWQVDRFDGRTTILTLTDLPTGRLPEDRDYYEPFALKFKKDFPEYDLLEKGLWAFNVYYVNTKDSVNPRELMDRLANHPDYGWLDEKTRKLLKH